MKQKLILLFALLCSAFILFSCSSDDEDSSTVVTVYVSDKTGTYYGAFGAYGEGMLIREEGSTKWECVPFSYINGFTYEKGNAYILKAIKVKVDPPLEDAPSWYYRLISQKVVEDTSNW